MIIRIHVANPDKYLHMHHMFHRSGVLLFDAADDRGEIHRFRTVACHPERCEFSCTLLKGE